jgi:hypothetical protein
MASRQRTRPATNADARVRLRAAQAYLEVADLALGDKSAAMPGVAAGVAVLAGIAASDAVCARRLQLIHRGDDHRAASDLLSGATPDGKQLARALRNLIDLKDEAHYGLTMVEPAKARRALGWARRLVERAQEEIER